MPIVTASFGCHPQFGVFFFLENWMQHFNSFWFIAIECCDKWLTIGKSIIFLKQFLCATVRDDTYFIEL